MKAATFGVTLASFCRATKRIRFGGRELTVNRRAWWCVTRESEHESSVTEATRQRPFVGLGLCFGPERVARALLALAEAGGTAAPEGSPAFMLPCDPESARRSSG